MNPHRNLIAFLGGGSRKMGLFVLLVIVAAFGVFLGRITWPQFLGSMTALAAVVSLATALEDAAEKRAAGKVAPPTELTQQTIVAAAGDELHKQEPAP